MLTRKYQTNLAVAIWLFVTSLSGSGILAQTAPSVDDYFSAYLEARDETIEGVQARLRMHERGMSASTSFEEVNENTQTRVNAIYDRYGFTPPSHLEFGTRFRDEIKTWLAANPDVKSLLRSQDEKLKELSDRMRTIAQDN